MSAMGGGAMIDEKRLVEIEGRRSQAQYGYGMMGNREYALDVGELLGELQALRVQVGHQGSTVHALHVELKGSIESCMRLAEEVRVWRKENEELSAQVIDLRGRLSELGRHSTEVVDLGSGPRVLDVRVSGEVCTFTKRDPAPIPKSPLPSCCVAPGVQIHHSTDYDDFDSIDVFEESSTSSQKEPPAPSPLEEIRPALDDRRYYIGGKPRCQKEPGGEQCGLAEGHGGSCKWLRGD